MTIWTDEKNLIEWTYECIYGLLIDRLIDPGKGKIFLKAK